MADSMQSGESPAPAQTNAAASGVSSGEAQSVAGSGAIEEPQAATASGSASATESSGEVKSGTSMPSSSSGDAMESDEAAGSSQQHAGEGRVQPQKPSQAQPSTSTSAADGAGGSSSTGEGDASSGNRAAAETNNNAGTSSGDAGTSGSSTGGSTKLKLSGRVARTNSANITRKLTVHLLDTYKNINMVYYARKKNRMAEKKQQDPATKGVDDEHGDYIIKSGDVFKGRYQVQDARPLGKGSFGQVVRVYDSLDKTYRAMKIVKNRRAFHQQAQIEIKILSQFKSCGDVVLNQRSIVRLLDTFTEKNHQCLVFELLGLSLYDLLKRTKLTGVSLNLVKKFSQQILLTLEFLSHPSVDIIHCDLKPENVLLRNSYSCAIKVIDFGSSCKSSQRLFSYIQSRFYRSPEVIMNLPYTQAIDMWSLGCMMVEMHTGQPLFNGHSEAEQLFKIMSLTGMLPQHMIDRAGRSCKVKKYFQDSSYTFNSKPLPETKVNLHDVVGTNSGGPGGRRANDGGHTPEHYEVFVDLVLQMLNPDPDLRIKPTEALKHRFFSMSHSSKQSSSSSTGSSGGANNTSNSSS